MRGVAAIGVVVLHQSGRFTHQYFPNGYFAVDFFFMLSGFVISLAYQQRLDAGWPTGSFLRVRAIRLYPLYGLSMVIGIAAIILLRRLGEVHVSEARLVVSLVLGLLMLPAPYVFTAEGCFPFNYPAWSLFMEVVVNVIHALFLRRRTMKFLGTVVLFSGAIFVVTAVKAGTTDIGYMNRQIVWLYGFSRVVFGYVVGMMLFRVWKAGKRRIRMPVAVQLILLIAVMAVPIDGPLKLLYQFLIIFGIFPGLVLAGATASLGPRLAVVADLVGRASYAIYVLHVPMLPFVRGVWRHVSGHAIEVDAPWGGLFHVVFILGLALLLDEVYDAPMRRFLLKKFTPKPA